MPARADAATKPLNLQRRWLRWAAYFAMSLASPVQAQSGADGAMLNFSISPQPLASALNRYGDATGNEALYEGGLMEGRISGDVQGSMTPTEALRRLLTGTGLFARFVAEGTFVLALAPQLPPTEATLLARRRYYALVQEGVLHALCRLREVRPGTYRLITTFWIAPNGAVADVLRVGTSGSASADELIDKTLRELKFREPPPADFSQPVRLLFVPDGPGVNSGCAIVDARLQAGGMR